MTPNPLYNSIDVFKYLPIRKSENLYPHLCENIISYAVFFFSAFGIMLTIIKPYQKMRPMAVKINYITPYNPLPIKLETFKLFPPQFLPDQIFRICHVFPELLG
jgi:hypothetical protein